MGIKNNNLSVSIGKLKLKNPVMVASGTFGYGEEFKDLVSLKDIGAIITKSITLEPYEGNKPPRIWETTAGMLNAIGLQNDGIDDNRFDISKTFEIADELEIDCKNGTIKLNSVDSPIGLGDGGSELAEWVLLAKGNNSITVGTDDATIDIDINITFNKVYFY